MIAALWAGSARAQEEAPAADPQPAEEPAEEVDVLSRHRTRFDVLAERAIGTTSRPVEFNWRRTSLQVAATGSFPFELNNFNTLRAGAVLRKPAAGALFELGLTWSEVWDSPSSEMLALTPYRQPGRPDRLDIDLGVGLPVAEGVVTTFPKFFPAVEMVFTLYGGLRYSLYPTGFVGMKAGEIGAAVLAPALTDAEIDNLDDERLDAMQTDPGRYGVMAGIGDDLYFESGIFVSPRFLVAIPLLAPASRTELLVWADVSLAVGLAF